MHHAVNRHRESHWTRSSQPQQHGNLTRPKPTALHSRKIHLLLLLLHLHVPQRSIQSNPISASLFCTHRIMTKEWTICMRNKWEKWGKHWKLVWTTTTRGEEKFTYISIYVDLGSNQRPSELCQYIFFTFNSNAPRVAFVAIEQSAGIDRHAEINGSSSSR